MKNLVFYCFLPLLILLSFPSSAPERIDYRKARYNNVCKDLKGDALLYYIFIDTKTTSTWTEFDIITTIDSMNTAVKWLEDQAKKNNITLNIKSDYFIGKEFTTINRNLPNGTVNASLSQPGLKKGTEELNKWADFVARKAGESLSVVNKDGIPQRQNPKNAEQLIAHLRDEYVVESVALIFLVNNYYRTDISFALNTFSNDYVEYAIVSYKYPAEIAHNVLHLYGAADLYLTPLRKSTRKIQMASDYFPKEIMQDPYAKNIWELEISDYTKYLIGWVDEPDEQSIPLLTDKLSRL